MKAQVLDTEHHARLIADLDHICQTANIPKPMIERSATEFCGPAEVEWLSQYPQNQQQSRGLILVGQQKPSPETKMMAMTAALLRNFIDSRVVTLNTVVEWAKTEGSPEPSVIMIPNLYGKQKGRTLPSHEIQALYDLLLSRFTSSRLTVGYVDNLDLLEDEYGRIFAQHLRDHYQIVEA